MPLLDDPSELNQRVTFNTKTSTKINGVSKVANVPVGTVWAAVITQRLLDRMANTGNQVNNTVTFVIRERQNFDVTNQMTITWAGQTYEIKDITPDTVSREWKTIICEVITQ